MYKTTCIIILESPDLIIISKLLLSCASSCFFLRDEFVFEFLKYDGFRYFNKTSHVQLHAI